MMRQSPSPISFDAPHQTVQLHKAMAMIMAINTRAASSDRFKDM